MSKKIQIMMIVAGSIMILLLAGFTTASVPSGESFPLPPRPTAVPVPTVSPVEIVSSGFNGQKIQLNLGNEVEDIPSDLWTIIEWQDSNTGDWYETDGWRGTLNTPTTQEWWVGSDMFGDGLFRWQLYASQGGELLATSESFQLPSSANLMVIINMTLE